MRDNCYLRCKLYAEKKHRISLECHILLEFVEFYFFRCSWTFSYVYNLFRRICQSNKKSVLYEIIHQTMFSKEKEQMLIVDDTVCHKWQPMIRSKQRW